MESARLVSERTQVRGERRSEAQSPLASPGCKAGTLPLSYDPAGREGIEPSLRVLEAWPVTMTLRPKDSAARCHSPRATRRGIEPLSLHRQWSCGTTRITGQGGDGRGSNPPPQGHNLPSSPDEYRHRSLGAGAPRPADMPSEWVVVESHHVLSGFNRALSLDQLTTRAWLSSRRDDLGAPGGNRTRHRPLERRASWPLDDRGTQSPRPESNRSLPLTRRVLAPSSCKGTHSTTSAHQLQRKESNLRKTG